MATHLYHGIEITNDEGPYLEPGKFFLIKLVFINDRCREEYRLRREPGRTNGSHEIRLQGWLGETNNISRHAYGAVEVFRDSLKRLRIRPCDADALLAECETAA